MDQSVSLSRSRWNALRHARAKGKKVMASGNVSPPWIWATSSGRSHG